MYAGQFSGGEKMHIVVIGGCNVDIITNAKKEIIEGTSNIADIYMKCGGVGRNIAENMHRLGAKITFITSVGRDAFSSVIIENLEKSNIDYSIISHNKTGIYTAIINEKGILQTAFCDAGSIEKITFEEIYSVGLDKVICEVDGAVVDANLCENTINDICSYFRIHDISYALECVSNEKCVRLKDAIKDCSFIKPNRYEAELLTKNKCSTKEEVMKCCSILHEIGAKNVMISLGAQGFYFSNGFEAGFYPVEKMPVINVTGAGDSLMASGFIGILSKMNFNTICNAARKCASLTCMSEDSVSDKINADIFIQ